MWLRCSTRSSHAIGLNDVCDTLARFIGPLSAVRGATAPARNTLSHANRTRDAAMAESLLWSVLEHLQTLKPGFGIGRMGRGVLRRFRRCVHAMEPSHLWAEQIRDAGGIVEFDRCGPTAG